MPDPRDTLVLLDRLEGLGFDDVAFRALHHFREGARPTTIDKYRASCKRTAVIEEGSENERTQRRLKLVLAAYVLGGFTSRAAFLGLAEAALAQIPTAASQRTSDVIEPRGSQGEATKYIINVDLETANVNGGGSTDCRSELHKALGRHFDLTLHTVTCGRRKARSSHQRATRYWDDNGREGFLIGEVINRIVVLRAQHPNAFPRRCHSCGVDAHPPYWD